MSRAFVVAVALAVTSCAGASGPDAASPVSNRTTTAAPHPEPGAVPFIGDPRASVTLTYWFDYACPYCVQFSPTLDALARTYGDRIVVYYKNFPLKRHPHSRDAAIAAEAARRQGKYFEMYHLLIARSPNHGPAELRAAAAELGLDLARFDIDVGDPSAGARIDREYAEGEEREISFVPALQINGRLYDGDMDVAAIGAEIDRARR